MSSPRTLLAIVVALVSPVAAFLASSHSLPRQHLTDAHGRRSQTTVYTASGPAYPQFMFFKPSTQKGAPAAVPQEEPTAASASALTPKPRTLEDATTAASASAPAPTPKPRTLEDDLPQLQMENELTSFVTKEEGAKTEQKGRLLAVQDRLTKTMELKSKVEGLLAEELKGITDKLEAEATAEQMRAEDIKGLMDKFEAVLGQKCEAVEKDEMLLSSMKSTLGMVREASIQRTVQSAIDDKAALCTIERVLIGKMQQCLGQLAAELDESAVREAKMSEVRGKLPAPDDPSAVRAYGWQDVESLNGVLAETAQSALAREAAVETIKADFAAAMDRRREVLSGEVKPLAAPSKLSDGPSIDATVVAAAAASPAGDSSPAGASAARPASGFAADPPTNDELAEELSAAAAQLSGAVLELGAGVAGGVAQAVGSADAAKAAEAAGAAVGGLGAAWAAALAAWERTVEDTVATNVGGQPAVDGEWWVAAAWKKMWADAEVQQALKATSAAAADAAAGLGTVGSQAVRGSGDGNGLKEVQAGTVRLAKVVSAVATRVLGSDKQLPPGK